MRFFKYPLYALLFLSLSGSLQAKIPELKPEAVQVKTAVEIVTRLRHQHYQRHAVHLDDKLSAEVLDRYLDDLDPDRSYFLASDIQSFEKYRYKLDDDFREANINPAFTIFNVYQQRISERYHYLIKTLKQGIHKLDFTKQDKLRIDRKDQPWPANQEAMNALWKKRLKNDVLNLKLAGKKDKDIQELLLKRYENQVNRIEQTKSEDAFRVYMNALTSNYDPHTQYFSPRATENFNIRMSLSLEGIGAMLQQDDEYTKVIRLIPAGPADKSGKLKANDRIIGVGQGKKGNMVDVIGWRLDDVVDLIRGPKDSVVRLNILPGNAMDTSKARVISITRDKVKLEDQAATKKVMEFKSYGKKYRLGIIDIPKFYIDFDAAKRGDPNYTSTTRDVRKLLRELKQEHVDGVVIDLRDNGGGSLQEVNDLIGLFIKNGPTVQVRSVTGRVYVNEDTDNKVEYSGPLAVLVNRLSASASEIFAGAIQDYHRGIIIGSRTYGKGTVQAMLPLNHGQITLTQQKFYRITGNSTQNKGVMPDIKLPSLYDTKEIGESAMPHALPWDHIRAAKFRPWGDFSTLLPRLKTLHEKRVMKDPDYRYLVKTNEMVEKQRSRKFLSLNLKEREKEKKDIEKAQLALENDRRKAKGLKPIKDMAALDEEKEKEAEANKDDRHPQEEALLSEAGYILIDYITLDHSQLAEKN